MEYSELFWKVPLKELKQGYSYQDSTEQYICLVCGKAFEKGIIYKAGETLYEAEKYAALHLAQEHGSMFDYLIGLNKKLTGLSDLQKNLLRMFYEGYSDNEIVKQLDGGSASTIRNHRFALREKEKQAKLFLAIMELLEQKNGKPRTHEKSSPKKQLVPVHRTATIRDERYAVTEEEYQSIVLSYFKEGLDGPLSLFPKKEKRKIVVLSHLINRFEPGRRYTEKEVNAVLEEAFVDYVTLRRYLIEYGFMDREEDGSAYWVKEGVPVVTVERRSELLQAYKNMKRIAGVYAVKNQENGKILVGSSVNLDAIWNRIQFELDMKGHRNKQLQRDWKEFGNEAFAFEVLEEVKEPKAGQEELMKQLAAMEASWIEKLKPFEEKGYNEGSR
ncbi:DUF2087 domain-containing protein [Paenibacillus sp. UNC451MF]|uniref:DUF2087 domain-containing protein n=1 Tax=Paenibacillus sp. UNC451MF TaxID=1449063 RepID=UPI00055F100E|nr:DUF2087 domain-containing protein [Paenibacillus sp. UNC451MF]